MLPAQQQQQQQTVQIRVAMILIWMVGRSKGEGFTTSRSVGQRRRLVAAVMAAVVMMGMRRKLLMKLHSRWVPGAVCLQSIER